MGSSSVFSLPENVGFNIHSFGDDGQALSAEDHERWSLVGGIDSFLSYECNGYISHPNPFVAKTASLMVNPLGSLDRFNLQQRGSIGHGWYDGRDFLIRLYLDLTLAQQLLSVIRQSEFQMQSQTDLLNQIQRDTTSYDPSGLNIRFDLFDLKHQERSAWTSYDICRIYT